MKNTAHSVDRTANWCSHGGCWPILYNKNAKTILLSPSAMFWLFFIQIYNAECTRGVALRERERERAHSKLQVSVSAGSPWPTQSVCSPDLEDKTTRLLPKPGIAERVGSSEAEDTQSKGSCSNQLYACCWHWKSIETDSVVAWEWVSCKPCNWSPFKPSIPKGTFTRYRPPPPSQLWLYQCRSNLETARKLIDSRGQKNHL
jgi:hypothetical protein